MVRYTVMNAPEASAGSVVVANAASSNGHAAHSMRKSSGPTALSGVSGAGSRSMVLNRPLAFGDETYCQFNPLLGESVLGPVETCAHCGRHRPPHVYTWMQHTLIIYNESTGV